MVDGTQPARSDSRLLHAHTTAAAMVGCSCLLLDCLLILAAVVILAFDMSKPKTLDSTAYTALSAALTSPLITSTFYQEVAAVCQGREQGGRIPCLQCLRVLASMSHSTNHAGVSDWPQEGSVCKSTACVRAVQ